MCCKHTYICTHACAHSYTQLKERSILEQNNHRKMEETTLLGGPVPVSMFQQRASTTSLLPLRNASGLKAKLLAPCAGPQVRESSCGDSWHDCVYALVTDVKKILFLPLCSCHTQMILLDKKFEWGKNTCWEFTLWNLPRKHKPDPLYSGTSIVVRIKINQYVRWEGLSGTISLESLTATCGFGSSQRELLKSLKLFAVASGHQLPV